MGETDELGIEVTQLRDHVELLTSENKKVKAQLEKRKRKVGAKNRRSSGDTGKMPI